jgi:uncharacterized protein YqfB (UPF0267 family)
MNHASRFFRSKEENTWKQITNVNSATYDSLALSKTERRYVTTTDGKKMVWVIYPNFDATKNIHFILPRRTTKR